MLAVRLEAALVYCEARGGGGRGGVFVSGRLAHLERGSRGARGGQVLSWKAGAGGVVSFLVDANGGNTGLRRRGVRV